MKVSIIVPAYNAAPTLAECIDACLKQTWEDREVIVVDDGSTDDTPRIAQSYPVHYIRQENSGPAAARNHGAWVAKGAVVAFTDADCVPHPDWVEHLMEGIGGTVVAAGGTYGIANPESLLARMVNEEIAVRHERLGELVDFLGSFNVAYRKDAFDAVGGFDESFRMASAEDNDLSYRLQDAGYLLRFCPEAVVDHFHPTRLWPYLRTQMWHGYWRVKLYRKHAGRARKGDQYAGLADLLAPALTLIWMAGVGALLGSVFWSVVMDGAVLPVILACLVFSAYSAASIAFRTRMTHEVRLRLKDSRAASFQLVVMLRDLARGIGMVLGLLRFGLPLRGRT
jgi:glycosyltransferase involved in cell wall biosynthesis